MSAVPPARILVVDDQEDIRELARLVLAGAGYDVRVAGDGDEALTMLTADADTFDLVLLDINMPGMDGWQTLRLIRAEEALTRLAVVMFSVKGEVRDKVTGLQEGAVDYITKPFVVDALIERVARVIGQERGA